jgi:CheY-like chemotaxis protein
MPDRPSLKILVVEDEFLIASEIEAILEGAGHTILGPAGSVDQAIELLAREAPDIAVIDANLRGESSAPLAEKLRERGIPFGVCTGYRQADLRAGFGDVVTLQKPIVARGLLALVDQITAGPVR